ncbi:unnamed protein product [Dimorphilus gyrociliatus]|uniref:branched-chain-amino-acid transaminase n=1 Tax=Dimorphilus gyrociliatus TaxID=2664684 RepID=A0A7I8W1L7_9ANNE|nr:unnamed protein product [Dimorphilus gyrociliatus]
MKFLAGLRHLSRSTRSFSGVSSFRASELEIEITKNPLPKPDPNNLVFGHQFSDHMLEIDWSKNNGWGTPKINPLRNFSMHPAAKVFHYAVELFEGLKAYRGEDNIIRLFRPDKNMARMKATAVRSHLPDFEGQELIECIKRLISVDKEWVPHSTSSTLYIRPTLMGTDNHLGVSPPTEAKLFVITGPVGPYYPTGFKPISLLADPNFVRAWEGGCGSFKMGCNYAPTILLQSEAAKKHNCQQILWLYGKEEQLTEVGTMNIFMMWKNEEGGNNLSKIKKYLDIITLWPIIK